MPVNILTSCSDLVFPRSCFFCASQVDRPGRHLCSDCLAQLPFLALEDADGGGEDAVFDRVAVALRFEGQVRELLHAFKFSRALQLKEDLVDFLEAAALAHFPAGEADVVIPVSLTFTRRWNRGYNQSALLASSLARRLDRRFDKRALRRTGRPKQQSLLSAAERRANVRGTFVVRCPEMIRGRTVLVVDDILTTGATLSECARVLKEAGAARVWALAVARTVR